MKIVQKQLTTAAFPTSARPMARESTSTQSSIKSDRTVDKDHTLSTTNLYRFKSEDKFFSSEISFYNYLVQKYERKQLKCKGVHLKGDKSSMGTSVQSH